MPDQEQSPTAHLKSCRLRTGGFVALVLGTTVAGIVYWLGTRSSDSSQDPSMAGYSKPQIQQMEMMYGKMGSMIEDFSADLKRPGVQAVIILAISALIAFVCFYFARLIGNEQDSG